LKKRKWWKFRPFFLNFLNFASSEIPHGQGVERRGSNLGHFFFKRAAVQKNPKPPNFHQKGLGGKLLFNLTAFIRKKIKKNESDSEKKTEEGGRCFAKK
jgi:hypothetical protein